MGLNEALGNIVWTKNGTTHSFEKECEYKCIVVFVCVYENICLR